MFYVYVHIRLDTGEIFYVGKGKGKRAWNRTHRTTHWSRVVKKYGRIVKILSDHEHEHEAYNEEIRVISELRSQGLPLVNISNGGGGPSGRKLTDSQKQRVSEVHKGKKLSPEHIKKLVDSHKGKPSPLAGKTGPLSLRWGKGLPGPLNGMWGKPSPCRGRKVPKGIDSPLYGKPSGNRKLSDPQVIEIDKSPGTFIQLARLYGCSRQTISNIKHHKTRPYLWK